jgi:hypothetical protein
MLTAPRRQLTWIIRQVVDAGELRDDDGRDPAAYRCGDLRVGDVPRSDALAVVLDVSASTSAAVRCELR